MTDSGFSRLRDDKGAHGISTFIHIRMTTTLNSFYFFFRPSTLPQLRQIIFRFCSWMLSFCGKILFYTTEEWEKKPFYLDNNEKLKSPKVLVPEVKSSKSLRFTVTVLQPSNKFPVHYQNLIVLLYCNFEWWENPNFFLLFFHGGKNLGKIQYLKSHIIHVFNQWK